MTTGIHLNPVHGLEEFFTKQKRKEKAKNEERMAHHQSWQYPLPMQFLSC